MVTLALLAGCDQGCEILHDYFEARCAAGDVEACMQLQACAPKDCAALPGCG